MIGIFDLKMSEIYIGKGNVEVNLEVGAKYIGTMSADGSTITGKWSQGGPEQPLNLTKKK